MVSQKKRHKLRLKCPLVKGKLTEHTFTFYFTLETSIFPFLSMPQVFPKEKRNHLLFVSIVLLKQNTQEKFGRTHKSSAGNTCQGLTCLLLFLFSQSIFHFCFYNSTERERIFYFLCRTCGVVQAAFLEVGVLGCNITDPVKVNNSDHFNSLFCNIANDIDTNTK